MIKYCICYEIKARGKEGAVTLGNGYTIVGFSRIPEDANEIDPVLADLLEDWAKRSGYGTATAGLLIQLNSLSRL